MDYFQDLLNSYQAIKKRKFSVSLVVEQAAVNPNASIEDALQRAQQTQGKTTSPEPYSGDIGVYKSVRGDKVSAGLVRLTPGKPMPGGSRGASYISQDQIASLSPESRQQIEGLMRGEQAPEEAPQAPEQQAAQEPQAAVPLTTSQNPEVQQQLEVVKANLEKLRGDPEFGSFISKSSGFWDQAFKRFYQTSIYSGSFASKLDQANAVFRSGGKLITGPLPAELAAKGTETFNRFLDTAIKLHRGTLNRNDALELRDYVVLSSNGKGLMLRFDKKSDDGLIINWDSDDSLYATLTNTYLDKLKSKTLTDKELGEFSELELQKLNLSGGGKNFNNLRGTVSESFQAVTTILMRGIVASQMCAQTPDSKKSTSTDCKNAEYNKTQGLMMLKELYLNNRENLIPAFEIIDNYLHHETPGTKATQELTDEVQSMLSFVKEEFPKKLMEGVTTPEDKARYAEVADKIFFKVVTKLAKLDAKTVLHRSPLFVGETGQSEANDKKTDITEVYASKGAALTALKKMGYDTNEAASLVVPFADVVKMYGGIGEYSRITKTPLEKIKRMMDGKTHTILNGIKTYMEEDGVSLGSGSYGEALSKMSNINNQSINTFAQRLGVDKASFAKTTKQFSDSYAFIQGLKDPAGVANKDRRTLIDAVKKHLDGKGLGKSYEGLSGKSESDLVKTLTQIQTNMLFDNFDALAKTNKQAADDFMSMIIMSAAAATVNQQTEARFLRKESAYSFNHNESIEGPLRMVRNGQAKFVRAAGQTVKIVDNDGNLLLQYNVSSEDNVVKGAVHLPFNRMKAISKAPMYGMTKAGATNDSTEILIMLLSQQKNLIESLLSKYQ